MVSTEMHSQFFTSLRNENNTLAEISEHLAHRRSSKPPTHRGKKKKKFPSWYVHSFKEPARNLAIIDETPISSQGREHVSVPLTFFFFFSPTPPPPPAFPCSGRLLKSFWYWKTSNGRVATGSFQHRLLYLR